MVCTASILLPLAFLLPTSATFGSLKTIFYKVIDAYSLYPQPSLGSERCPPQLNCFTVHMNTFRPLVSFGLFVGSFVLFFVFTTPSTNLKQKQAWKCHRFPMLYQQWLSWTDFISLITNAQIVLSLYQKIIQLKDLFPWKDVHSSPQGLHFLEIFLFLSNLIRSHCPLWFWTIGA